MAAQELEPRAYSVSPRGANFAVFAFSRATGDLSFDPTLPIENASATLDGGAVAYVRSIDFLGRSASVGVQAPYIWGTLQGTVNGAFQSARRSGLGEPAARFSVNLHGAPSMDGEQFQQYRQGTIVGASAVVSLPLGQYDPARLINVGSHRWAVKPEVGLSQHLGRWFLDLYLGAWFFGPNDNLQGRVRRQDPIGSAQVHITYTFTRRLWAAVDANFYTGGRTSIDGAVHADLQRNSRVGATVALRVSRHQAVKFSVAKGAVTNIGANFTQAGLAYQYLWGGGL